MQTTKSNWDELKNQYYHNLQTLHTSIDVAHNSSIELYRLYNEVMKKSKNTDPNTLKKFVDLWLKKLNIDSVNASPDLKKTYQNLIEKSNPNIEDLNEFERTLHREFKERALVLLSAYNLAMEGFYDTWMEMWSN